MLVRDGARLLVAYRDAADPPRVHVASLDVSELPRDGSDAESEPTPAALAIGDPVPAARVLDADGRAFDLTTPRGEAPLLVAFFARWCQPCRAELRQLQALRARLPPATRVIAVSLDEGPASRAEAVARRWGYEGTVLRDARAAAAMGVPPLPATFFFDAAGRLRGGWVGRPIEESALLQAAGAP